MDRSARRKGDASTSSRDYYVQQQNNQTCQQGPATNKNIAS